MIFLQEYSRETLSSARNHLDISKKTHSEVLLRLEKVQIALATNRKRYHLKTFTENSAGTLNSKAIFCERSSRGIQFKILL